MMKAALLAILSLLPSLARATTYTLSVTTSGAGGYVVSSTGTINCGSTCSQSFSTGTVVTLTEVSASSWSFAGWGGADGCGTSFPTCTVTMTADRAVSATFNPYLYLSISTDTGIGVVVSTDGNINCSSSGECANGAQISMAYPVGSYVYLVATPVINSTFTSWGGDCSGSGTCAVLMSTAEYVTADFTSTGPITVAVDVGGSLYGEVTSSPTGISCGASCSSSFSTGTVITLTASTTTADAYFAGWANGGCSGSVSTCTVTATSQIQGLGGSQTPTAFFYKLP